MILGVNIYDLFVYSIFIYSILLLGFNLFIAIYSIGETFRYILKNRFTDYSFLAMSPHAPGISILAPAYNEGMTIIENVKSLLSIFYQNSEVIVINDGSKDDSLQKLIQAFHLEKINLSYHHHLLTKAIRGIYKSQDRDYSKLTIVDKENGGKGDALNAGINLAAYDFLVCIDVDCILHKDALIKIAKTFLEETKSRVIAAGAGVRIVNSCEVINGSLSRVILPNQTLPLIQTLEYIRVFLLGRMAWSRLNGLMIISGAFGAFDKEIVIKCGGYYAKTVGEDLELVVRMRRFMEDGKMPYKVTYIPEPLCWTEAPFNYKILGRQRNRWMRGTVETLRLHKKLFFNPRYKMLGMLSYPYWLFFEFLAPVIEFIGLCIFFLFALTGFINWFNFFVLVGLLLAFGIGYNFFAILVERMTYNHYRRPVDFLRLVWAAVLEPIILHPFTLWSGLKGVVDLLQKKNSWGEMTRQGFVVKDISIKQKMQPLSLRVVAACRTFAGTSLLFLAIIFLLSLLEIFYDGTKSELIRNTGNLIWQSMVQDIQFWLKFNGYSFIIYLLSYFFSTRLARGIYHTLIIVVLIIHVALIQYFHSAMVPLGADLYAYSWSDIKQTIGASGGINMPLIITFVIFVSILIVAFRKISTRIHMNAQVAISVILLFLIAILPIRLFTFSASPFRSEYANNIVLNKSDFFYKQSLNYLFDFQSRSRFIDEYARSPESFAGFKYIGGDRYPFQHSDQTSDVLSPYFNKSTSRPNVVILLVEGLGRAFSNDGAYLGNFTPFIDSLANESLYWRNFMSNGGRTFAVLPSLLGSLPFDKRGFLEMDGRMPDHLSLLSLLKFNGYHTSFYYGGDSRFDNMDIFLKKNSIDELNDEKSFPAGYTRLPDNNGFSWGFNDKELFRRYLDTRPQNADLPQFSVLLTVSTHSPFLINEEEKYLTQFERRMNQLAFDPAKKEQRRDYKLQLASVLYLDDALRQFFAAYSHRTDFNNTIFLITGDHRMPEIPMSTKIDRYHVPLLIYSRLLKRTARFSSISTHFDIAPSLLAFLQKSYSIELPNLSSWMGEGLDTARIFRNIHSCPLMQTKNDLVDFIMGDYHLNGDRIFRLHQDMNEEIVEDKSALNKLRSAFGRFLQRNRELSNGIPLLNDSVYRKYFPKAKMASFIIKANG